MRKVLCLLLAVWLLCLPALAEVSALPEGTQFLSPRETAREILDIVNTDFAGEEGAFAFDSVMTEDETGCIFYNSENFAACIMDYDETNMGVKNVAFVAYDVDEAYICASMLYHIVELLYGANVDLINWFDTAFFGGL